MDKKQYSIITTANTTKEDAANYWKETFTQIIEQADLSTIKSATEADYLQWIKDQIIRENDNRTEGELPLYAIKRNNNLNSSDTIAIEVSTLIKHIKSSIKSTIRRQNNK